MNVKQGETPEFHGFTPEEIVGLAGLLKESSEPSPVTESKIIAEIKDMLKLEPKKRKKSLWTDDGLPRVKYIEHRLKRDITEGQRDAAWEGLNKGGY